MNKSNKQNQNCCETKDTGDVPDVLNGVFSKAREISLHAEEKTKGYESLANFIQNNPSKKIVSPYGQFFSICLGMPAVAREKVVDIYVYVRKNRLAYSALVTCLILVLVAAPAFASQSSLPGDILYPLKIGVVEKVEDIFTFRSEEKARIAVKHAIARAAEAERLIAQGKIDAARVAALNTQIAYNAKIAQEKIDQLKIQGKIDAAIKISSDYESKLAEHNRNIKNMEQNAADDAKEKLAVIRQNIRSHVVVASKQRNSFEEALSTSSPIVLAKKSALNEFITSEVKIKRAEQFVSTSTVPTSTRIQGIEDVRNKVKLAKKTFEEAQEKLETGSYDNALQLFKTAQKDVESINNILENSYNNDNKQLRLQQKTSDSGIRAEGVQPTATTSTVNPLPKLLP